MSICRRTPCNLLRGRTPHSTVAVVIPISDALRRQGWDANRRWHRRSHSLYNSSVSTDDDGSEGPAWRHWLTGGWSEPSGDRDEPTQRPLRGAVDASGERATRAPAFARAVAALAPRAAITDHATVEDDALLESYRGYVMATTIVAIASAWDSGQITRGASDQVPFEAEVFGLAGRRCKLATPQLIEALTAHDEATERLAAARSHLIGKRAPLDVLCDEHGIGEIGALVLMFVAAPALWGEITRLYSILGNDPARATCDQQLLWQLLGSTASRRDLARELERHSPLLRHGIVRIEHGPPPFQALQIDPSVIKLLAGLPVEDDVEHGVARVPATVALDRFMTQAGVVDRALADLATAPPALGRVVVRGATGSGRRTLLAALAQLAGRTLATIDVTSLVRENRLPELARLLQRAHLCGWLPCVDGLDAIASEDSATRRVIRELLRVHHGPLAVRLAPLAHPPLDPGYVLIDLPSATLTERSAQWAEIAAGAGLTVDKPDALAAQFAVGPGTIHNVVTAVARTAPPDVDLAIEAALRQHLETRLGAVASRVTRLASWSQIILPSAIQDSIAELIARVRHRRTVYDAWGFDQVMASSRGLTALFQGGPGTGKTLLASALAHELGLDLYRVDLARVLSKWIGETEQNLARVFDAAEQGQAMILFDEADALFGQRAEVRTATDRYANLEINYLLQRLDSFEGVAVLTTNLGTAIDPAFKRRLTCCLTLPFPDAEARERLWRAHLPAQLPIAGALDLGDLAKRYEMSGGYIRNAALRAAFLAAQEQVPLSQFHLERAIRTEFRDGGKHARSGALE
jgi:hypothetical protein